MKTKQIALLLLAGLIVSACSKEDRGDPNPNPPDREKSMVSLVINNLRTRGASTDTEAPTPTENAINTADGIKVYVFKADGELDYSGSLTLTQPDPLESVYESEAFEVTTGENYFYVFLNDGDGLIQNPTGNMEDFMKQIIGVDFDAATGLPENIATDNKLLIGTLWRESIPAPGGGTDNELQIIELNTGRLVSKINLIDIDFTIQNTDLNGAFSDATYRLGTIAKKINTVGIHDGNLLPTANGVLVTSAVHTVGLENGSLDAANYLDYMPVWKIKDNSFYATENTTALSGPANEQFYGNTTYIQLETTYTPDAAEVYNPKTLGNQTLTDNTFWTAQIVKEPTAANAALAGKTIILSEKPTEGDIHEDIEWIEDGKFPEYTNGKNYHKFPIFDDAETDVVKRNRVLRNHYYEFEVDGFLGLGDTTSEVDPKEPIESKTTVKARVTILPWSKVTGSTPVG